MDRLHRRSWLVGFCCLSGLLPFATGCNLVATGMYVLTGNDTPAEYEGLKGKKVAIVCRPVTALDFNNSSVSTMLAQQLGQRMKQNIKDITIIDQRKIEDWSDENTWEEYVEIGKAVGAEMVLGIDLEEFSLYQGQTLYQGRANMHFAVYDVSKGREHVWEKFLPQVTYPPTGGVPASERPENEFRRKFVGTLADQVARFFYAHDSTASFAADSTVLY